MYKPVIAVKARVLATLLTLVGVGTATPARAQSMSEHGGRVFGLVGGSFGDGSSAFMTSGGAGLRLTRHLGLDVELVHAQGA